MDTQNNTVARRQNHVSHQSVHPGGSLALCRRWGPFPKSSFFILSLQFSHSPLGQIGPSHNFYDQAALSWLQSLVSSVYAFTPNTRYPQVIMMELMMNIYDYNGDDHDNPTSLCRIWWTLGKWSSANSDVDPCSSSEQTAGIIKNAITAWSRNPEMMESLAMWGQPV